MHWHHLWSHGCVIARENTLLLSAVTYTSLISILQLPYTLSTNNHSIVNFCKSSFRRVYERMTSCNTCLCVLNLFPITWWPPGPFVTNDIVLCFSWWRDCTFLPTHQLMTAIFFLLLFLWTMPQFALGCRCLFKHTDSISSGCIFNREIVGPYASLFFKLRRCLPFHNGCSNLHWYG